MAVGVPAVEVADDGDVVRVRRPDGEISPADAGDLHRVRAEFLVEPVMPALVEQVQVEVGKQRRLLRRHRISALLKNSV